MSKKPGAGSETPDQFKNRHNRLVTNSNQDNPNNNSRKNLNHKSVSSIEVKVSPPTSGQPAVRIVNGPGSLPTPEQPKSQYLSKSNSPEPTKLVTVTSLATSESKL